MPYPFASSKEEDSKTPKTQNPKTPIQEIIYMGAGHRKSLFINRWDIELASHQKLDIGY